MLRKKFDVFLSHNSKDKPAVRELGEALKARGLAVWLDEWELVPGRPWQEAIEEIIQTTKSAAVLIGKDGLGPWEIPEMRACLSEFVSRQLPVIPVLLPDAPAQPALPLFLKQFTWVDLRGGLTEEGIERIHWGITGKKSKAKKSTTNQAGDKSPAAGALTNSLHQLPPPPSDFIGREDELRALRDGMARGGVAISGLSGMGGVGKTVLALKLAAELDERYPDAALYLDLKGVEAAPVSVASALQHFIHAFEPTAQLPDDVAQLRGIYLSRLHDKRALVLLDNARDAAQVAPLCRPPRAPRS